jgi:hypothetical protein
VVAKALIALAGLAVLAALAWAAHAHWSGGAAPDKASASTELPPVPWAQDPKLHNENAPVLPPAAVRQAAKRDPSTIPPASAGTNGSFDVPSPGERRKLAARTHPPSGPFPEERTAILLGGTAIAPPSAPEQVKGAISAANMLVGQPYKLGGGHAGWRSAGYDCSGAVSFALAGAGLLGAPATSGQLMGWGKPGPGRWLTLYANPGHVYAVIAGLRWDTVGDAKGSGPRWHPFDAYPSGFAARHLPGL